MVWSTRVEQFFDYQVTLLNLGKNSMMGMMLTFSVFSSPKVSDAVVEPYN